MVGICSLDPTIRLWRQGSLIHLEVFWDLSDDCFWHGRHVYNVTWYFSTIFKIFYQHLFLKKIHDSTILSRRARRGSSMHTPPLPPSAHGSSPFSNNPRFQMNKIRLSMLDRMVRILILIIKGLSYSLDTKPLIIIMLCITKKKGRREAEFEILLSINN